MHAAAPTTRRPLSPDGSEAPPPGGGSARRRSEQEPRPGGSGRSSWCPGRGSAPYSGCPVSRPSGGSAVSPRESWGSARVHCAVRGAGHSAGQRRRLRAAVHASPGLRFEARKFQVVRRCRRGYENQLGEV